MGAKRAAFLALAVITAVISSGCWDALDINKKSMCTLVITDRVDDNFVFYAEVPNLTLGQQQETSGAAHYDIVVGAGDTYTNARRAINNQLDKPLFLGTVRALMLTDKLAKYGVEEYFYRMQTMVDYRRVLEVVTTHSSPEEIFSVNLENNVSLGYEIDDTITTLKDSGKLVIYTASDVLNFIYADRSYVVANMDAINGRLTYNGYTVMKGSHYVDFIPVADAGGLVWLLGHNIVHTRAVPVGEYSAAVEIKIKSRKIRPQYVNGQVVFNIDMVFTAQLMYTNDNISIDKKQVERITNELQNMLLNELVKTVQHSQSISCDYLELWDVFRIHYPGVYRRIDWPGAYRNAVFNITVTAELDPGGMMDMEAQGRTVP